MTEFEAEEITEQLKDVEQSLSEINDELADELMDFRLRVEDHLSALVTVEFDEDEVL